MQTAFSWKQHILRVSYALVVAFVVCLSLYAQQFKSVQVLEINTAFHFLVIEDTHLEAGAAFVKLEGGAGYLLKHEGKEYVVLSVYLQKSDGELVQTALSQNGKKTKLISLSIKRLYLKRRKDKNNASTYKNALHVLRSCIAIMEECVEGLEKSMTQETCKRIISQLIGQFKYLSEIYKDCGLEYVNACVYVAQDLLFLQNQTVYARDLRYILCCLAVDYVKIGKQFSL